MQITASASALGSWTVSDPIRANETSDQSLGKKPLLSSYGFKCEKTVVLRAADLPSDSEGTSSLRIEPSRKIETEIGREVRH